MDFIYNKLASLVLSYKPNGLNHIEIVHKWFADGDEEGPAVLYLQDNGEDIGNRMEEIPYDEFSEIFHANSTRIRDTIQEEMGAINIFREIVHLDGIYTISAEYDHLLDAQSEAEIRSSLGDELYEKLEQERKNFKEPKEEPSSDNDKPMTEQEIFSFLYHELGKEAPDDWQKIIVDVNIFVDDNGLNNINADYAYKQAGSKQRVSFTPSNVFGSMNAFSRLMELMDEQGAGWQKATFTFHNNGKVEMKVE